MTVKATLIAFITFIAGLIVGIVLGARKTLEFRPEISLGEAVNALLAIILLGLVTTYLQKAFGDLRSKKDLLFKLGYAVLDNLTAVEQTIGDAGSGADLDPAAKRGIDRGLTTVNNCIGTLEAALKKCNIDLAESGFSKLNEKREELWRLITDDPYPTRLDATICRAVQNPLREMRVFLSELLLFINDM